MTFTAVGSPISYGSTTFTMSPQAAGDLVLMEVITFSGSVYCTGISGGGCDWQQISEEYPGGDMYANTGAFCCAVFAGKVTAPGSGLSATLSFNGDATSVTIRGIGHEFSSSMGGWALDKQAQLDNLNGTDQLPSISPSGAGGLYFIYCTDSGNSIAGSTPGYTYGQDAHGNCWAFNPDCTAAVQAPTTGDPGNQFGSAVLLKAAPAPPAISPVGGWQLFDVPAGNVTLNCANEGDLMALVVLCSPASSYPTGVSGGGCTWQQVGETIQGTVNDWAGALYTGTVKTAGNNQVVTVSFNGSTTAEHSRFHEFEVVGGGWSVDDWGLIDSPGTSDWTPLNATGTNELYYGYAQSDAAADGSQSGWAYRIDGDVNMLAYTCDAGPGTVQPVMGDGGERFGMMLLVKTPSSNSGLLMAGII